MNNKRRRIKSVLSDLSENILVKLLFTTVILVSVIILLPLIFVVGLLYVSWEITNALFCREKYNYDEDSFNIDFNDSKWGKFSYDYDKWIDKLMEEE